MTVLNKLRKISKLLVTKVVPQRNGNCDWVIVHIRTLPRAGMHWVHHNVQCAHPVNFSTDVSLGKHVPLGEEELLVLKSKPPKWCWKDVWYITTGVSWGWQNLRYDPSYFVVMIFAWCCGVCLFGRVITQLAGLEVAMCSSYLFLSPTMMTELTMPTRTSSIASSVCE